jgi:FkbM family methyltransferase
MQNVLDRLQDQKSIDIFNARVEYMIDRNINTLLERLLTIEGDRDFIATEVEKVLPDPEKKKMILFGCGQDGRINKRILEKCGYEIYGYCDNFYTGIFEGKRVMSVGDAALVEDAFFVISSRKNRWQMYEQLVLMNVNRENILLPIESLGIIAGFDENQYFDVFKPRKNEIFLDAGSFDGATTKKFLEWAGNGAKAYILEASERCYRNIEKTIREENWTGIELIKGAAWFENTDLYFGESGSSSRVGEQGEKVRGVRIDDVVPEASFVKMDIEGAEVQAIRGAQRLIQKCKPRMAISLYHNPEDVISIPAEILKLNSDYKFIIRHYSTERWETVLYAYI